MRINWQSIAAGVLAAVTAMTLTGSILCTVRSIWTDDNPALANNLASTATLLFIMSLGFGFLSFVFWVTALDEGVRWEND